MALTAKLERTGGVLLAEYIAIHDKDLKTKYETSNGANTWSTFPTAATDYDEKWGMGKWNLLIPEEREVELDKARQRYYFKLVHCLKPNDKEPGQTALCLSGGGIQSAAFALGLMQGLARHSLLSQFHYLSTVSGGGYIGAWLTAWAHRAAASGSGKTFKVIETALAKSGEAPEPLSELRKYQAFLTPKVGIASPDTWAAAAIVIRNMLLNWLVFLPLLASVLLIPRFIQSVLLLYTYTTNKPSTNKSGSILVALWGKVTNPSLQLDVSWDPHTWLDGAAALAVGIGIAVAMANRSVPYKRAIDDRGFGIKVLFPVVSGAFMLVAAACSWLANGEVPNPLMLLQWAVLGALAFVLIRIGSYIWVRIAREKAGPAQRISTVALELIPQAVAGAVIGVVIWSGLWLRYLHAKQPDGSQDITFLGDVAVFGVPWFLMAFLAGQVLLAGLTSHLSPQSGDRNREWWARAQDGTEP